MKRKGPLIVKATLGKHTVPEVFPHRLQVILQTHSRKTQKHGTSTKTRHTDQWTRKEDPDTSQETTTI